MRIAARVALAGLLALAACTSTDPSVAPSPSIGQSLSPTPSVAPLPTPSTPEPFVVAVKGDWGAATAWQAEITEQMCALREREPFRDVITTGDNFYDPDGTATRSTYYGPERCLYEYDGHRWRASWGNHDNRGPDTGEVLGAERWYSWSGGGADFFALDSNQVGQQEQLEWLEPALARSRAPIKIVYFHHPPYAAGGHRGSESVRDIWVPLFREHGVTLVLNGHNHAYEHHVHGGIHYVITGGGGAWITPCLRSPSTLVRCTAKAHFLVLRILPDQVEVEAILQTGETLDRFTIDVS